MRLSLLELRKIYENSRGSSIKVVREGSLEDLEALIARKKAQGKPWIDWFLNTFVSHCVRGSWSIEEQTHIDVLPNQPTTLVDWLKLHPDA